MIRVVADSNVYISALNFGGVADEVLALGRRQVIALFVAVVTADEADNRILECAVTAKAHLIVTGDNHLRTLGRFRSITIVSPREFLDARLWEAE